MKKLINIFILTVFLFTPIFSYAETKLKLGSPLEFPRDHGRHSNYPTEWWYFSGHLNSEKNQTYGFQLVFFKTDANEIFKNAPSLDSNKKNNNLYLAHFTITDDQNNKFYYVEKRALANSFKEYAAKDQLAINLSNWSAIMQQDGSIKLKASHSSEEENFELSLKLNINKSVLLYGDKGLVKTSDKNISNSYHYSFSRLTGAGQVRIGKSLKKVTANAWMDREILNTTKPHLKWDWFAIQLDNNQEIVLYKIRDTKISRGLIIKDNNEIIELSDQDFTIKTLSNWHSKRSGATYPMNWLIKIPKYQIELKITPTVKNQEIVSKINYWEGRNKVYKKNSQVGNAYVELVGY